MGFEKLPMLDEKKQYAIDLLLQGKHKIEEIAQLVGVHRCTLWDWRTKDKLFIAELDRRQRETSEFLHTKTKKYFEDNMDLALKTLKELLEKSENDNVKKETAQYFIERMVGKIPAKVETKDTTGEPDDNTSIIDDIPDWEDTEANTEDQSE